MQKKLLALLVICAVYLSGCTKPKVETTIGNKPITAEATASKSSVTPETKQIKSPFRFNQLGYLPKQIKRFVVATDNCSTFALIDGNGEKAFDGELVDNGTWTQSEEHVCTGDFSSFKKTGTFHLELEDGRKSAPFAIRSTLFEAPLRDAIRSFYFQRASLELEKAFAGEYAREAGHADTTVYLDETTDDTGIISSPGGWYDAGDYGKYVVNAGITVGTMLHLYQLFPSTIPDGFSNIPESGNGISDLLDEQRYELAWLQTMQAADGGVYFKLGPKEWPGFVMPAADTAKRWAFGKATTGTLVFAALMAKSSVLFRSVDQAFAAECLERAERAWRWALANPGIHPPKSTSGTGEYGAAQHSWIDTTCAEPAYLKEGDSIFDDEFLWAAAELLIATGSTEYKRVVQKELNAPTLSALPAWWEVTALAYYSLFLSSDPLTETQATQVKSAILTLAAQYLHNLESSPYRVPYDCFYWGSSASFANAAILFAFAHRISSDPKWLDAAIETTDYLFGKNATGYSFVTGHGSRRPMHIHHRPSGSDNVDAPIPGFLAGGPNRLRQDDISKSEWGAAYPHHEPAKCYVDDQNSYASNEIAINWTAPMVFVLGYLNEIDK